MIPLRLTRTNDRRSAHAIGHHRSWGWLVGGCLIDADRERDAVFVEKRGE